MLETMMPNGKNQHVNRASGKKPGLKEWLETGNEVL
jgi:hypothetical protein